MTVQSEVYVIILLTVILGIAIVVIGKKVEKADPFAEPQGILKPVLLGMTTVYNSVKTNVGKATADKLTPYITVLWVYIFMSNTVSLFGLESPTANLSVTLLLAFITWVLIQITELKYGGWGAIIGLFFGLFFTPVGMILGSLLGAFAFELLFAKKDTTTSVKSAFGAFLGFIFGTGAKLITSAVILYYIVIYAF